MANSETTATELLVDRLETGCIAIELIHDGKTFYVEIGETTYSAYLQEPDAKTVYFKGNIDV